MYTKKNYTELSIIPCRHNTKIPATPHGLKDACTGVDVAELISAGYNVGVACAPSEVITFDLDYHDPDSMAWEELKSIEAELDCVLPRTLTQTTASGNGMHLIFSSKGIQSPKGKLSKNIDIRYNAYIMFAPSVINGRQYKIVDGLDENGDFLIAELPEPWINYVNKNGSIKQTQSKQPKNSYSSLPPKTFSNINVSAMFDKCAFLAHCRDNAAMLSEPEWFSMISVLAPIEGSDVLIHGLSRPYANYNPEETQNKIENARRFGRGHSCVYISGCFPNICGNCPFRKGGR